MKRSRQRLCQQNRISYLRPSPLEDLADAMSGGPPLEVLKRILYWSPHRKLGLMKRPSRSRLHEHYK